MKHFDFHCHLDAPQFDEVRENLLVTMHEHGVGCTTIGVDMDSSRRAVALARSNDNVWASVGQHPLDNKTEVFRVGEYQRLIDDHAGEVVCIGECGLDYYWPQKDLDADKITAKELETEKKRQKLLFIKNITLASANDLPLMLHVRSSEKSDDAHRDTLKVLAEYPEVRAVFHFYTEGPELAQDIIDAGHYISLPGVVTFADLDETVKTIPLERLFAETDSPYAAPKAYRGQTNQPTYVQEVYKKIAEVKELSLEEVRTQILRNVEEFYKIQL